MENVKKYVISNKIKQQNGITLIALVITIIVLIILASISITTLTGDKGIIQEARENSEATQKESIIEKLEADLLKEKMMTGNTPTKDDLKRIIQENGYNEGTLGDDSFSVKDGEYSISYSEIVGWQDFNTMDELK